MGLYTLAIFSSAFLLFHVQPLIAKYILPWFGGTPAVWTTCMLFFQVLLLAGYAYAHALVRFLPPRRQGLVHLGVLVLAVVMLPITPDESWKPVTEADPAGRILALLAVCVGLPYLVLASTGPLLQAWFAGRYPGRSPYRLYAVSNLGSLLALLGFPFFFEPRWGRLEQAQGWSLAYGVFALLCGLCAWQARSLAPRAVGDAASPRASGSRKALWLALPAIASLLLLSITNELCQDVAVIPFLWVLPLCLYLLSFIVCFDRERWYFRPLWIGAMAAGLAGIAHLQRASRA